MSLHDDHAGTPAPWRGEHIPAVSAPPGWDDAAATGAAPRGGRRLTPGVVLRAIRRHWWQILLAWGVGSAALVVLIYTKVKPSYESIAYVRIDPPSPNSVLGGPVNVSSVEGQLETQAQRMMTNEVLGLALAMTDAKVSKLPRIQMALDAQAELRREVRVAIVPRTRFITISMTAPSSAEGVIIVNAVAGAYEKATSNVSAEDLRKQTERLTVFRDSLQKDFEGKKDELRVLVKRMNGATPAVGSPANPSEDKGDALTQALTAPTVTHEEFHYKLQQLEKNGMDLLEAEKKLDYLKTHRKGQQDSVKMELAVADALKSDQLVASLAERYSQALAREAKARRMIRNPGDPALVDARKALEAVKGQYRETVAQKKPLLRKQLQGIISGDTEQKLRDAEEQVAMIRVRQEALTKNLKAMKILSKEAIQAEHRDTLEVDLAKQEMAYIRTVMEKVQGNLQATELDAQLNTNKVHIVPAIPSNQPSTNNRTKLMAATPVLLLAAVLGLFVTLEIVGGRVADPDDLSTRLQLGVIGIVPPLPASRPARGALTWGNDAQRSQRLVEEFVQSLDHLRVQIWAGRGASTGSRCILITSACVAEGKSTLAAQLAGRCANAGLTTLLVDADLRRPSQSRLLDVAAGPGLADVLAGRIEPEEAMVVVGHAGGFHLMPAGTSGLDPSPLLHGERLGTLMARFREAFDIVIVDAPPVLAVPDALVLGRWTDGAVLAVRHDTSRFPLVERARQKLASVGVPILGAVVNGVRSTDSNYSNYSYSSAATGPEAGAAQA